MSTIIPFECSTFETAPRTLLEHGEVVARGFTWANGIAGVTLANSRGKVTVLPHLGQTIWGAVFDDVDLRMTNMFAEPRPSTCIQDNYGCFAFHSGLLSNGCPAPEDVHPLHGEFPCASAQRTWLEIDGDAVRVRSDHEYVRGFEHHYLASPGVRLAPGESVFDIHLTVQNLSAYQPMPLQYMCHINQAYVEGGVMRQSFPDSGWRLRESVPAHVHPTEQWREYTAKVASGEESITTLDRPEMYDPEIVFFAEDLPQYGERVVCELVRPDGRRFVTEFSTAELPYATRWILHNPDQKLAAHVLPGTCLPEGHLAAKANGSLIELAAGESRSFSVRTGLAGE